MSDPVDTKPTVLPDIPAAVTEAKLRAREQWPVRSNRVSQLGHPCERQLTYWRANWKDAALPDAGLQYIFDEGKVHEKAILQTLRDAGFTVLEQERAFEYREHEITGRIDGKIVVDGKSIPLEVKSCSAYVFDRINSVDDLYGHPYHFIRMWPDQMLMYLLLSNNERGILLLKNKTNGQLKQIVVTLDYARAEELVKKADRVNMHAKAGTLPDRIPYDEDICGRCPFFSICLPDQAIAGATWEEDEQTLELLRKRADLEQASRDFKRVDDDVKDLFKKAAAGQDQAQYVIGAEFLVTVNDRKVSAERAPRPARVDRVVKIQRLGKKENAADG